MKVVFSHFKSAAAAHAVLLTLALSVFSQANRLSDESSSWGLPMLVIVIVAIVGIGFLVWRRSKAVALTKANDPGSYDYYNSHDNYGYDVEGVDVDKELEWFRKAKKPKPVRQPAKPAETSAPEVRAYGRATGIVDLDTRAFQEKMRKAQYVQLPINSFVTIRPPKQYEELPYSEDPSLLSAIEQAGEEFEEDEVVRDLAVKILAAFRTRNSVEALSQLALYDLSSNLRSKAVATLTDFDHPSVFEPILLACADPTREVRAAAARGLFKLSFDRADAWKRIAETNDEYRMRHAARAAIESGIAVKSFERLVHEDMKVAQEAFALVAFMIAADETKEICEAIASHKDERVRFALLHVLKVQKDDRVCAELEKISKDSSLTTDVADRVRETFASLSGIAVR